jgi:hypothetical protein
VLQRSWQQNPLHLQYITEVFQGAIIAVALEMLIFRCGADATAPELKYRVTARVSRAFFVA